MVHNRQATATSAQRRLRVRFCSMNSEGRTTTNKIVQSSKTYEVISTSKVWYFYSSFMQFPMISLVSFSILLFPYGQSHPLGESLAISVWNAVQQWKFRLLSQMSVPVGLQLGSNVVWLHSWKCQDLTSRITRGSCVTDQKGRKPNIKVAPFFFAFSMSLNVDL